MSMDIVDDSGQPQEIPGPFGAPVPEGEAEATLRADELNLFDSTAVAVSSVARPTRWPPPSGSSSSSPASPMPDRR